nr:MULTISPECIES: ketopantoate reductase C-terminal domain-containing protein [Ramlibacter]
MEDRLVGSGHRSWAQGVEVRGTTDSASVGAVSRGAAEEALRVARGLGISLAVTDATAHVRAFGERGRDARPSVLLDHERGRTMRWKCSVRTLFCRAVGRAPVFYGSLVAWW